MRASAFAVVLMLAASPVFAAELICTGSIYDDSEPSIGGMGPGDETEQPTEAKPVTEHEFTLAITNALTPKPQLNVLLNTKIRHPNDGTELQMKPFLKVQAGVANAKVVRANGQYTLYGKDGLWIVGWSESTVKELAASKGAFNGYVNPVYFKGLANINCVAF